MAAAETSYRRGVALAEDLLMRPLGAHCHLGLAKLYRCPGQREQATKHLTTATAMCREMDVQLWLEHAAAEMRELL